MNCREITEFLYDYVEGELGAERQRVFEQHLDRCPACQNYLTSYRATIALAGASKEPLPLPCMPEDLVAAIMAAARLEPPAGPEAPSPPETDTPPSPEADAESDAPPRPDSR